MYIPYTFFERTLGMAFSARLSSASLCADIAADLGHRQVPRLGKGALAPTLTRNISTRAHSTARSLCQDFGW